MASANWFFNPLKKESRLEQLYNHNQNEIYLNYLTENYKGFSDFQISELKKTYYDATGDLKSSMIENLQIIGGTIERQTELMLERFELMGYQLQDISNNLVEIANILSLGFSSLIETQRLTNQYLSNIQILSGLPDDEKRRSNAFEKGMRHLSNAVNYDKRLYTDAYRELEIAKNLDPTDYFVLYALGLIHLNTPDEEIYDVEKAKYYFTESAWRANIDLKEKAAIQKNFNRGYISKNIFEQAFSLSEIRTQAFQSFYQAAYCCYILNETEEAIKYAEECLKVLPDSGIGLYILAKSYLQLKDKQNFLKYLEKAIRSDANQSIVAGEEDKEICDSNETSALLEKLRLEIESEMELECKNISDKIEVSSKGLELFKEIKSLVNEGSYLSLLLAKDKVIKDYKYEFTNIPKRDESGLLKTQLFDAIFESNIHSLIEFESLMKYELEQHNKLNKLITLKLSYEENLNIIGFKDRSSKEHEPFIKNSTAIILAITIGLSFFISLIFESDLYIKARYYLPGYINFYTKFTSVRYLGSFLYFFIFIIIIVSLFVRNKVRFLKANIKATSERLNELNNNLSDIKIKIDDLKKETFNKKLDLASSLQWKQGE